MLLWLASLLTSKKVLGQHPLAGWGPSEGSLHVLPVPVWVFSGHVRLIGDFKLSISVNGSLALCVYPVLPHLSINDGKTNVVVI